MPKKTNKRGQNEGSIRQRPDGIWEARYSLGFDANGKRIHKSLYSKSRREVADKLAKALNEANTGTYIEPTKVTVKEWYTLWLNEYAKNSVRQTTFDSYKTQVEKHIIPNIGNIKLCQLQTANLQTLYNKLLEKGRLRPKEDESKGLSPRTVRYVHMIIHSGLEQAIKDKIIKVNVSDSVRLPHDPKKEMKTLDTDKVGIFLNEAKKTRYYAAYVVMLTSGLRRGELIGLRWGDIDLKNCTLTVSQQLVRTNAGLIFTEPKTALSRRTIVLSRYTIKALKEHKAKQAQEKLIAGTLYQDDELIFCTEIGKPTDPKNFVRSFHATLKRAELEKIRLHDLRHTFSVLAMQAGVPIKAIQENLGHHTPAFTLEVYGHVNKDMKKQVASKMGNIIEKAVNR